MDVVDFGRVLNDKDDEKNRKRKLDHEEDRNNDQQHQSGLQ